MAREVGKATTKRDRAQWSMERVVKETKKLIRTDWGGKNAKIKIMNRLRGAKTSDELATRVRELCEEQVEGCRKRCSYNFDEMLRRISGQ